MTRRKVTLGPAPRTTIELRSIRGVKPAWSRTLEVSNDPAYTEIADAFVKCGARDPDRVDVFLDGIEAATRWPDAEGTEGTLPVTPSILVAARAFLGLDPWKATYGWLGWYAPGRDAFAAHGHWFRRDVQVLPLGLPVGRAIARERVFAINPDDCSGVLDEDLGAYLLAHDPEMILTRTP